MVWQKHTFFLFFFFFLLTRGKKNDPMWSGHSGSRWSAVDSDNTCWCFAYIQTTRGGWRLTQRPFLRPALSKKKKKSTFASTVYICTHLKKNVYFLSVQKFWVHVSIITQVSKRIPSTDTHTHKRKSVIVSKHTRGGTTHLHPLKCWRMRSILLWSM